MTLPRYRSCDRLDRSCETEIADAADSNRAAASRDEWHRIRCRGPQAVCEIRPSNLCDAVAPISVSGRRTHFCREGEGPASRAFGETHRLEIIRLYGPAVCRGRTCTWMLGSVAMRNVLVSSMRVAERRHPGDTAKSKLIASWPSGYQWATSATEMCMPSTLATSITRWRPSAEMEMRRYGLCVVSNRSFSREPGV